MADDEKVENRYRTALHGATPWARTQSGSAASAFSSVIGALASEAWVSTTADAFSATCSEMQGKARDAGSSCVEELTSRYSREPAKVDVDDYRATWH